VLPARENHYYGINQHGFNQIVYDDWGNELDPIIICVHGLTGNAHDFNWIAPHLVDSGYRVISVDMPGRGRSEFLKDPKDYNYKRYLEDLTSLFAHLGINENNTVDWLGVSMGGLLGIILASMDKSPIKNMIINDIGPSMPKEDLKLISQYISQEYRFQSLKEMENFMRQTRGLTWGPITDDQWEKMAKNNARSLEDGSITYAFDPNIAEVFSKEPVGDVDLWRCWDSIKSNILILRGSESTIFPEEVAADMCKRGPGKDGNVELITIKGCGHVPSLMEPNQIKSVCDWLNKR
jgi:pimeloyl-ACP methyl ester carboxylesterase